MSNNYTNCHVCGKICCYKNYPDDSLCYICSKKRWDDSSKLRCDRHVVERLYDVIAKLQTEEDNKDE